MEASKDPSLERMEEKWGYGWPNHKLVTFMGAEQFLRLEQHSGVEPRMMLLARV